MNVLVVEAAGKTGSAIVEQALAAGHQVTAFVHKAAEYQAPAGVRIVEGDAADRGAMEAAVQGQDAVLDTIGGKTPYQATTLEASVAHTIIAAMQRHGVRRLVVTSMLGVGDSVANSSWYLRLLVATFLRGTDHDKTAMEATVEASELDWVILRPAILTDGPATGNVRVFAAETGEKAHEITRADLAAFYSGPAHHRRAPAPSREHRQPLSPYRGGRTLTTRRMRLGNQAVGRPAGLLGNCFIAHPKPRIR